MSVIYQTPSDYMTVNNVLRCCDLYEIVIGTNIDLLLDKDKLLLSFFYWILNTTNKIVYRLSDDRSTTLVQTGRVGMNFSQLNSLSSGIMYEISKENY